MMRTSLYKFFCALHKLAKKLLGRSKVEQYFRMVDIRTTDFDDDGCVELALDSRIPGELTRLKKSEVFPVENIVPTDTNLNLQSSFKKNHTDKFKFGVSTQDMCAFWEKFLDNSTIPDGYKNAGCNYAGFILDANGGWCLPSWIWTNAAITRLYCKIGQIDKAKKLAQRIASLQLSCGGWVVRDDYSKEGPIPVIAPNDSAYIANNTFIELYKATGDSQYLDIASKCADWIIDSARNDGLVHTGQNANTLSWLTDYVIVDIGFTAALFGNLYEITNSQKYKLFLEKFTKRYIELFFLENKNAFTTSINASNQPIGGTFARGQAWALEGLIGSFKVTQSPQTKDVIVKTIKTILDCQLSNGGWPYVFSKPYLGEDCKGVAVIAKSLMDWHALYPDENILKASKKALDWCKKHTLNNGEGQGGIYSFNMEGAIVHHFYSRTAFVYSCAYALELKGSLNEFG